MYKVIGGYIVYVTIGCDPLACGICKKYTSTFMYYICKVPEWVESEGKVCILGYSQFRVIDI